MKYQSTITRDELERQLDENLAVIGNDSRRMVVSWTNADPLFAYVGPHIPDINSLAKNMSWGCLTMIKNGSPFGNEAYEAPELTEAIRADDRIPATYMEITPTHLPIFKEWQLRIWDYYHGEGG